MHQVFPTHGLLRIDDNQAILATIHGFGCSLDQRAILTVTAQHRTILNANFRDLAMSALVHLEPELSRIWLWLRVGRPCIANVLILACKLTGVTAVALVKINDESLHPYASSLIQLVMSTPSAGS